MGKILSREELESYLYRIRNTLCAYDYERLANVIFFNNEAVYEYLCDISLIGDSGTTVGDALDAVSAFIPIKFGENSLEFIMALNPAELSCPLESVFAKKSRMEFLQLLTQISNGAEWICLISLCETIRLFREKEGVAALT